MPFTAHWESAGQHASLMQSAPALQVVQFEVHPIPPGVSVGEPVTTPQPLGSMSAQLLHRHVPSMQLSLMEQEPGDEAVQGGLATRGRVVPLLQPVITTTATTAKSKRYLRAVWPRQELYIQGIFIDNTDG